MSQVNWGAIIGVIVGFLLSQVVNIVTWLISSKKEKKLIRLLVTLEIDQNLALLKDYWQNVSLPPDEGDEDDEDDGVSIKTKRKQNIPTELEPERLARRAAEIPLPVLSNRAFDSQLSALPKALDEAEISQTWHVYEEIEQVKALHSWLLEIAKTSVVGTENFFPSASRAIRSEKGLLAMTFKTKKIAAIFDLRKTIQLLLNTGNPLTKSNPSVNIDIDTPTSGEPVI